VFQIVDVAIALVADECRYGNLSLFCRWLAVDLVSDQLRKVLITDSDIAKRFREEELTVLGESSATKSTSLV
jgi:hypothetical protein